MSSPRPRILLADGQLRRGFYAPFRAACDAEFAEGYTPDVVGEVAQWDLIVTADERWVPEMPLLTIAAVRAGVPVLHVVDGILEWRNLWDCPLYDFPGIKSPPMYHPAFAHKIACIGRSQARAMQAWIPPGRCEVVGLPRLDHHAAPAPSTDGPLRVLVCTATTAFFTPEQHAVVRRSLQDLRAWFRLHPTFQGRAVEPTWRLTGNLAAEIGVASEITDLSGLEMATALGRAHAVITTPSTIVLEAMLAGRPVARLDYFDYPAYVPSVWTLHHQAALDAVLPRLLAPSAGEMDFQSVLLDDALEHRTPALPRLLHLARTMIDAGRSARAAHAPLTLPERIVPLAPDVPAMTTPRELGPTATELATAEHLHLRRRIAVLEQQLLARDPWALGLRGLLHRMWRSFRFRLEHRFPQRFPNAAGHRYRARYPEPPSAR